MTRPQSELVQGRDGIRDWVHTLPKFSAFPILSSWHHEHSSGIPLARKRHQDPYICDIHLPRDSSQVYHPPDTRSFCIQQSITWWGLCWVYGKTSLKAGLDATFSSLICSLTFFFLFSRNNVSSFTSGPASGSLQRALDGEVKPCFWILSSQHLLGFVNSFLSTPMMNKSLNVWHVSKQFFPVKVLLASG